MEKRKYAVGAAEDVRREGKVIVRAKGMEIGLFYVDGAFYAWRNMCPHAGAPVCAGPVGATTLPSDVYEYRLGCEGAILRCPWHGWEFDLRSGEHLTDAGIRLRGFSVAEENGQLFVLL